jgi:sigma-B regulation protein RsbU (phosphoserine phosphatase)
MQPVGPVLDGVPWLDLGALQHAVTDAARRVLEAPSATQAHGATLPRLGIEVGADLAHLWWTDDGGVLREVDSWRSPRLERRRLPLADERAPDLDAVPAAVRTPPGATAAGAGLTDRLLVPLVSGGRTAGVLELYGSDASPPAQPPASSVVGGAAGDLLRALGGLLGAALAAADRAHTAASQAALMAAQIEVLPAGAVVVSADRQVLSINEEFLSMFGVPRRQALSGRPTPEALAQVRAKVHPEVLDLLELAHTQGFGVIQRTIEQPDGAVLDVRGAPVVDDRGVYRGRAWFVRDETARHRAETAVRVLADTLVASLIPPHLPDVRGARLASRYQSGSDLMVVGGDFYDVFSTGAGRWAVLFGDVCGSGPEAAVVTALARHTVRAVAVRQDPPSAVLVALNAALMSQPEESQRFLTAVQLELREHPAGGFDVTIACGGHPWPFVRRADGRVDRLGAPGQLLGVLDHPSVLDAEGRLSPGDVLVLVTDGVLEARDSTGEELGDQGLVDLLAATAADAQQLADAVAAAATQRRVGKKRDDYAVLTIAATG